MDGEEQVRLRKWAVEQVIIAVAGNVRFSSDSATPLGVVECAKALEEYVLGRRVD